MEIMNEKERKKIIDDSRKFGGISLRRQKLRVHRNGAKFPITKAYIDDELLDPEISYTLILLPEMKIAEKSSISLLYFQRKRGPTMYYSYPEDTLNDKEKEKIGEVMIQAAKDGFFAYQSSILSSLNYYFEIHSDWARGNKELLMLSVILNTKINQAIEEVIQAICIDFTSHLKEDRDLFKALYIKQLESFSEEEQSAIKKISEDLQNKIEEFYQRVNTMFHQDLRKRIITVSTEIENKIDLNQIAQKITGAVFNPERFPGLVLKTKDPRASVILFSTGKMVITDLIKATEAELVVQQIIKKVGKIGIKLTNPKISIQSKK